MQYWIISITNQSTMQIKIRVECRGITLRAKEHSFWRRSSRRTANISNFNKRLILESYTRSNCCKSFFVRFNDCTAWIASMLRFLPFCSGFRFSLPPLIVTLGYPSALPSCRQHAVPTELGNLSSGLKIVGDEGVAKKLIVRYLSPSPAKVPPAPILHPRFFCLS